MTKFSCIKNRPLLFVAEAEESGKIKGVLVSDRMNKIYYLAYLDREMGTTFKKLVPLKKVRGFGDAAVAVENRAAETASDEIKEKRLSLFTDGAKVFDDEGNFLGRTKDLEFDDDGKVLFVVTETEKYPPEKVASFSEGVVVIGKKPVRPKVPKKIPRPDDSSRSVAVLSGGDASINPPRLVSDYSFLKGRVLTQDIYDGEKNLLIAKNTVVDEEAVERARAHFRLVDLTLFSAEK